MREKGAIMRSRVILFALGILLAVGAGFLLNNEPIKDGQPRESALLGSAPLAHAQEGESTFLEENAGIAAYVKIDETIDIEQLRESFKVVEQLNDQYLTGQIAVPDLRENWHPRMFVSEDGWIVAYYAKEEPTTRMLTRWIQSDNNGLTNTTLEIAIRETLKNLGPGMTSRAQNIQYYHFQIPEADRISLIRENTDGEDTFHLTIPSGLEILDATWLAYRESNNDSEVGFDGDEITDFEQDVEFGDLLPGLKTGTQQSMRVQNADLGVILIYQSP